MNNAVARAAGLLAIAALPMLAGLTGHAYDDPGRFLTPFRHAIWICVGRQAAGGVLAALTIRNDRHPAATGVDNVATSASLGLADDQVVPAHCATTVR